MATSCPIIHTKLGRPIPDLTHFIFLFEVKTSLGMLSKYFVSIELNWITTLGSVTLVRVKSARVTAIWIGDRYMK